MTFLRRLFGRKSEVEKPSTPPSQESPHLKQTSFNHDIPIENVGNEASKRLLKNIVESRQTGDDYFSHLTSITAQFLNENPAYVFAPHIQIEIGNDHRIEITITDIGVFITGFDTNNQRIVLINGASEDELFFNEAYWNFYEGFYNVARRTYLANKDPSILKTLLEKAVNGGQFTPDEMEAYKTYLFESPIIESTRREEPFKMDTQPWKKIVRLPGTNSLGVVMNVSKIHADDLSEIIIWNPQRECFIITYVPPEMIQQAKSSGTIDYTALQWINLGFWQDPREFINTFSLNERISQLIDKFGIPTDRDNRKLIFIKPSQLIEFVKEIRTANIDRNLDLTTCDFYLHPSEVPFLNTDNPCEAIKEVTILLEVEIINSPNNPPAGYRFVYNILFPDGNFTKVPIEIKKGYRQKGLVFEFSHDIYPSIHNYREITEPINKHGDYPGGNKGDRSLDEVQLNAGIRSLLLTLEYTDQDIRKLIANHGPLYKNTEVLEMLVWFAIGFLPATSTEKIVENLPEKDEPTTPDNTKCFYCGSKLPPEVLGLREKWVEDPNTLRKPKVISNGLCPHCQAPVVDGGSFAYYLAKLH